MNFERAKQKFFQLWDTGDGHQREEALELLYSIEYEQYREQIIFFAFENEKFDLVDRYIEEGWGEGLLMCAAMTGRKELIDKTTNYVRKLSNDSTEFDVSFHGLGCGGHFSLALHLLGKNYRENEKFRHFVSGVIYSGRSEYWDKLSSDDIKYADDGRFYRIACRVKNYYVMRKLGEMNLIPSAVVDKVQCLIYLGEYQQVENCVEKNKFTHEEIEILLSTSSSIWQSGKIEEKIYDLIFFRLTGETLLSAETNAKKFISRFQTETLTEMDRSYFFYRLKKFQAIVTKIFTDRSLFATPRLMKNFVSPYKKSDSLYTLIDVGVEDLSLVKEKIPELFTQEILLTLFLRLVADVVPSFPLGVLLKNTERKLLSLNCISQEEILPTRLAAEKICKLLLEIIYPWPLVQLILSF